MSPRLKERYATELRSALQEELGLGNVMQVPRLTKIVLNMGLGDALTDSKIVGGARKDLAIIAGQAPKVNRARKSVANFKLRQGNEVGVSVTLRGDRMYEFLDRLISLAIPRIRDFRGLNPQSFDGRGNYTFGVTEQLIFPEIDYDEVGKIEGMDITIVTTAEDNERSQPPAETGPTLVKDPPALDEGEPIPPSE